MDVFETSGEVPGGRPGFWLDTVCTQILPVKIDLRHDRLPAARMSCATLGALRIRDVVGGDHVYTRDVADIRRGEAARRRNSRLKKPVGGELLDWQKGFNT